MASFWKYLGCVLGREKRGLEKETGFGGKQRPTGEEREVILCMGWVRLSLLVKWEAFVLGSQCILRCEEVLEINP